MVLAWALADQHLRDLEGFPRKELCLALSSGLALLLLGWAATGRWLRAALWFTLGLVGQAVTLQLIDAGPALHYQHYPPFDRLVAETQPGLLLFLGLQIVLVLVGVGARLPSILGWADRTFGTWRVAAFAFVFSLSSATVSKEIPVYVGELVFATFVQGLNLATLVLAIWALPAAVILSWGRRLEALLGEPKPPPVGLDCFVALGAVWVTVLAALLSMFVYEQHPHVADEVVYLYPARYFAAGLLALPAPPSADAFHLNLMEYETERWYSPVPPGWPAMLALGARIGAAWLVNPLLGGLNVLLAYVLLWQLYDRRLARLAVLLLCASPWYVFMAMNFMTHTFTLTCTLLAAIAIMRARRAQRAAWAWLGGGATGLVSLIRPLEGLAVAGLLGLWVLGLGGRRLNVRPIAAFALGAVLVGATVLPYNALLTGDPTVFPIMAYNDKHNGPNSNALGFGPDRGMGWAIDPNPGHSLLDAAINANLNTFSINVELFGWSSGSLFLLTFFLVAGRPRRADVLMLAVIAVIVGIHTFYYFGGGPDFGARYWYLTIIPCVALTARGVEFLADRSTPASGGPKARVLIAVAALCLLALVNYFPWRAVDKYHHYLGMRPDVRYLAEQHGFGRSLVLIRGERHPDYASAATYNPLDLRADVPIYAWDRDPETRAQALRAYPDRPVWIVDGPSRGRGFQIVAGPRPASELLAEVDAAARPAR